MKSNWISFLTGLVIVLLFLFPLGAGMFFALLALDTTEVVGFDWVGLVSMIAGWIFCLIILVDYIRLRSQSETQPKPHAGQEGVTQAVIGDLKLREERGIAKYGTTLQTFNGRSALKDFYEELLDAVQYLKQHQMEQEQDESSHQRKP